jgi:hypothetical protein
MSPEAFAACVRQYCEWVDAPIHDPGTVHRLLLRLLEGAPRLKTGGEGESGRKPPGLPRDVPWSQTKRFTDFPFQSYHPCFWPEIHPEGQFTDNIHEDFAHIDAELRYGLQLMDQGNSDSAIQYWYDSYFFHWGHHASSAVSAIAGYEGTLKKGEPSASPNGGHAEALSDPGAGDGPPSVS